HSPAPVLLRHDEVGDPRLGTVEVEPWHHLEIQEADHFSVLFGHECVEARGGEPRAVLVPVRGLALLSGSEHFGAPELFDEGRDGLEVLFAGLPDGEGHALGRVRDPVCRSGRPIRYPTIPPSTAHAIITQISLGWRVTKTKFTLTGSALAMTKMMRITRIARATTTLATRAWRAR